MKFYIKNYDCFYDKQIDLLDDNYWGNNSGNKKVSEDINKNDIFKIAFFDNILIGFLHFKQIGNLIDCYHILVKKEYQNQSVASKLMFAALEDVKKRNISTLIVHAVEHEGTINAKNLLEKFDFEEIYRVKKLLEFFVSRRVL